ncbi:MAG: hypothetical protein HOW73_44300 [Polyangiaceae bacterium]|nr:hypothetical protein [Polyangiaceae bacterium]
MSSKPRRAALASFLAIPVSILAGSAAIPAAAQAPSAEPQTPQAAPDDAQPAQSTACVVTWTESRYRNYGYDHIVHLDNECIETAECTITTDSNPSPVTAQVPPNNHIEVLMFRGSPSRSFVAKVDCKPVVT